MKHAKPVLCAVRVGFMSLWMTFSFLKFRLLKRIKRIVNKQKNTMGLYWEVYIRKTKGIIKISVKKKKKKGKKNTEASVLRKIESSYVKSRYARIFIGHFCPTKNKALTFIQTKVYILSIRKKMTKSVLQGTLR